MEIGEVKRNTRPWLFYGLALVFWAATIFPSVSTKGWFFLDDPTQIGLAMEDSWIGVPNHGMGRYLPVFQLYRKLVYCCVGGSVAGFYLFQSLLFLATLWAAVSIVRRVTKFAVLPQLLTVIGLMSLSLAEPAYTLGKHEPLLALLLMLYVGVLVGFEFRVKMNRADSWIAAGLCFLLCMLAMWNKETSPVFVVFILPLMILPAREFNFGQRLGKYAPVLLASVAGILVAKTPLWISRHFAPSLSQEVYANFKPTAQSILANWNYYIGQIPDFFVVVGLVVLLLAVAFRRHRASREYRLASAAVLVAGSYLLGLLLWRWGSVYYSYPPQLLAAIAFALVAARLMAAGGWAKRFAGLACVAFIGIKLAAVLPFYYISNAQRIESEVYSRAVKAFAAQPDVLKRSKGGEEVRLFVENWSFISEQPVQTQLFLENLLGIKATVIGASEFISGGGQDRAAAAALFHVDNIAVSDPRIRPRVGDYVLAFGEKFPWSYNARAVSPCQYGKPQFSLATGIRWVPVSEFSKVKSSPMTLPLKSKRNQIGSRYSLYQIDSLAGAGVWTGRWGDLWVGKEACFIPFSEVKGAIRFKITPHVEALPNELVVRVNQMEYQRVSIVQAQPFEVTIPGDRTALNSPLEFQFEKTISPAVGNDSRQMSARVELVPTSAP